jgi:cytochrome c-type biogenesis protein CcmH
MRVARILFCLAVFATAASQLAFAADQAPVPGSKPREGTLDPAMATRLKHLEGELRCLVCQNQTLADSEAGLAQDLRNQVEELALEGKSDEEIKVWLEDRYGDFVLYRPRVMPLTYVLWFGPFVLVLGGLLFWWLRLAHARRSDVLVETESNESLDAVINEATGQTAR